MSEHRDKESFAGDKNATMPRLYIYNKSVVGFINLARVLIKRIAGCLRERHST